MTVSKPHRASREELMLIAACNAARAWGCFVYPSFFFTLLKLWFPSLTPTLSIQQIHEGLKNLEKDSFLTYEGTKRVQGRDIHLYYPTGLGFDLADFFVERMKFVDPRGLLSEPVFA